MKTRSHGGGERPPIDPVQESYAALLVWFVRIALLGLFVSFALYATGLIPSTLDIAEVPDSWHLSAEAYAEATGGVTGWAWVRTLGEGRTLAFASLVLFPLGTLVMVTAATVLYLRNRVPAYAVITFLELIVLVVAATGVLQR